MTWAYGTWSADHPLPIGASERAAVGARVRAGDIVARGTVFGSPVRVACARRLGVAPADLPRVMRVPPGALVERSAILARTGRRFARAVSAPITGRVVHLRADGDLEMAPIVDRWSVRSTLDGAVTATTDAVVTVAGEAWRLQGIAGYGPDAIGDLALAVDGPSDDLPPARIDVRQRDRILVVGGRTTAESLARAHACGVAAVVAGAAPAAGLRALYGDDLAARGRATRADAPTVLCLLGFGGARLPTSLFAPLASLAGARAAIHTATARLFVFAAADAVAIEGGAAWLALAADWGAVSPLDGPAAPAADTRFASEVVAAAVGTAGGAVPAANVLPQGALRA